MMDPKASRSGMYPWTVARERKKSALQHGSTHSSSSNSSAKSLSLTEEYAELQRHANIASGLAMEQTGYGGNSSKPLKEEMSNGSIHPLTTVSVFLFSRDSLQVLCDTMKRQIISRAFYGCKYKSTGSLVFQSVFKMQRISSFQKCFSGHSRAGILSTLKDRSHSLVRTGQHG